jgi:3-oxoacyl-[acyl-carrier protein] reductase
MPRRDLTGTVVIVTGTGSGLGRAMTLGLVAAGAKVAGIDIDLEAAKRTAADARGDGIAMPLACDITRVEDADRTIRTAIAELGGLHVLVNCAGIGMSAIRRDYLTNRLNFWDCDPDAWQRLMNVNVRGAFLMARAAAPHLMAQKWGRVVNVTTSMNTMIRGGNMPYGQSKAALEAATSSWAEDLEGTGVTANVLVPGGAADTPMVPHESPYDRDRLVRPDVMVAPVCWLASRDSDGINQMRFIGRLWNPEASDEENVRAAGAPAAWPELAAQAGMGQPKAAV